MLGASKRRAPLPAVTSARSHVEFRPGTGVLEPHIESFYLYRGDSDVVEGIDRVDMGQLRFLLKGEGVITFADGHQEQTSPVMVNGPGTAAASYRMCGPYHCFGVSLRGMGWKTLIGRRADKVADTVLDVIANKCGSGGEMLEHLRRLDSIDEMVAYAVPRFEGQLARARPVPRAHIGFLDAVREWGANVDPRLETLYAAVHESTGLGERQVQRLCKEYFAGSPAHLKRKFRAMAAAKRIYEGGRSEDVVGPFSDQSHMINEIRHFTGHTPTTLRANIDPILALSLDNETFNLPVEADAEEVDLTGK